MKLEKMVLANAFALATAVLWAVCSAAVWLLPGFSMLVFRWWVHGMNVQSLGNWSLNLANFFLGGITLTVSMWITGWVFGWAWEKTSKK